MRARFEEVFAIAHREMVDVATRGDRGLVARAKALALEVPAKALAESLVALDDDVSSGSLRRAGIRRLAHYGVAESVADWAADLPPVGPLLVVSNHPGLFDVLLLFAAVAREDLATLAARRPLLDALPNVSRRLLVIDEGASAAVAVRRSIAHLEHGGALLHFPAGEIEPDPARESSPIRAWKPGVDLLLRAGRRFDLRVTTALVSGVIASRARALARRLAPDASATDTIIPLLQLTFRATNDAHPMVRFGPAHRAADVDASSLRAEMEAMAALVRQRSNTTTGSPL